VTATPLAPWLTPDGYAAPRVDAMLREASAVTEAGRFALGALQRLRRRPPYAGTGAVRRATPVVLVPGFLAGDRTLWPLAQVLRGDGYRTYRSSIRLNARCTLEAAAQLERRLESISLRRGGPVQVVGHSLGGLIARYYVQRLGGDARVRRVVTLGTPHSGTRIAPLMSAHPIVRQMRPDSEVIAELSLPAPNCRTQYVAFWSEADQVMIPATTARIDHPDLLAHNVHVAGVGHLALPVNGTVAAGIREALAAADPAAEEGAGGAISVA
jgi:pimeloyl-ACP methyl ester carboxylesterase